MLIKAIMTAVQGIPELFVCEFAADGTSQVAISKTDTEMESSEWRNSTLYIYIEYWSRGFAK